MVQHVQSCSIASPATRQPLTLYTLLIKLLTFLFPLIPISTHPHGPCQSLLPLLFFQLSMPSVALPIRCQVSVLSVLGCLLFGIGTLLCLVCQGCRTRRVIHCRCQARFLLWFRGLRGEA